MSGKLVRALIVGSLLILGAAIGITLDRTLHGGRGLGHNISITPHVATELHRDSAVAQLHRILELDSGQAAQLDSTIRVHQIALEEGWGAVQPRVTAAMDSVHQYLRSNLTPEQWERFLNWAAAQPGGG